MRRRRLRNLLLAAVGGGLVVTLTGCGYNIPPNMVAIHVTAGPFESKKVEGCVDPSSRKFWTNDDYPLFPTSEREWDATGQANSDAVDIAGKPTTFQSVTKDNVIMDIPITVRFTLITECDTLKDFYVKYAQRYGARFDSDGTYNDAWETLLRKLMADPSDQTLDRIVQAYNWRNVWNDPDTKVKIEQAMNEALNGESSLLVQTAKGKYFEGISVLIGSPRPDNAELAASVAQEQQLVAQAQSEEAQARADKARAQAQIKVSEAEAAKQRATIEGFMLKGMSPAQALKAYNQSQAIAAGQNPFQPTYVIGGTLPAPTQKQAE